MGAHDHDDHDEEEDRAENSVVGVKDSAQAVPGQDPPPKSKRSAPARTSASAAPQAQPSPPPPPAAAIERAPAPREEARKETARDRGVAPPADQFADDDLQSKGGDAPSTTSSSQGASRPARSYDDGVVGGAAPRADAPMRPMALEIQRNFARERTALRACLEASAPKLTVTITVTKGVGTIKVTDPAASAKVRACLAGVAKKWTFTVEDTPTTRTMEIAK